MSAEVVVNDGQAWEIGDLGQDEKSVKVSSAEAEKSIEDALDLQMISVRLQKELLEQLKFLAKYHGIGYQPLMRDVLARWCRGEILTVARQMQQQLEAQEVIRANAKKRA